MSTTVAAMATRAGTIARAALIAGVVGAVLAGIDLATRPACPDNYVRLVDFELVLPVLAAIGAAAGAFIYSRSRRHPTGRFAAGLAAIALLIGVLTAAGSATWFVLHRDSSFSRSECWTAF
jgi:hypothetical protein